MNYVISVILLVFSPLTFSKDFKADVKDYKCLEIDPFVVGDVCLLNVKTQKGKNLSLVFSHDDAVLNESLSIGEMEGLTVSIKKDGLRKIHNRQALNELKSYDIKYYYMYADIDALTISYDYDSKTEIKILSQKISTFSKNSLPKGYKAVEIPRPKMNRSFKQWIQAKTLKQKKSWRNYVLNSDEFFNQSEQNLIDISNDPLKYLEVDYILEINKVYKITRNSIFIGYFYEITNWVESAIIQDGAWYEAFLTTKQQIVLVNEETN